MINPPGIEQDGALTNAFEGMLHLEIIEGRIFRQNLFQKLTESGDIPLTVAQMVDLPADCLAGLHFEVVVEGCIRLPHSQIVFKHEHGRPYGVYDLLRETLCVGMTCCRLSRFVAHDTPLRNTPEKKQFRSSSIRLIDNPGYVNVSQG